jgi:hypothetical protein
VRDVVTLSYNLCMISPNTGDIPRVGVQVPSDTVLPHGSQTAILKLGWS